ncbi:MAG: protein-L-isoaspartate O-methyltransferase family protein [Alphaproteobacteria bacterium]
MDYKAARHSMIESQLRTNQINNEKILEAIGKIDRQDFVPKNYKDVAYVDEDITIAPDRVMLEPLLAATFLQTAEIKESDEVLVVAAGLGYELALVHEFTNSVVAVEGNIQLRKQAEENLNDKSIDSIAFKTSGYNSEGAPEYAPFDVIMILGSVEVLPDTFIEQLREGGRLIYIKRDGHVGNLVKVTKTKDNMTTEDIRNAYTPILPRFKKKEEFIF